MSDSISAGAARNPFAAGWDDFVQRSPRGQFQQLSGWARQKEEEGWRALRVPAGEGTPEAGGVQLLWRESRFGRIGYASKGPVLADESPGRLAEFSENFHAALVHHRIRAVIVQPPDDSVIAEEAMLGLGYSRAPVPSVIHATALVDVSGGPDAIQERLGKKSRWEVRQAVKHGVEIRPGSRAELGTFFSLMERSCRRQGVMPNPSSAGRLERIWDELAPRVALMVASHEGKPVAGAFLIGCGHRLTLWKKGWDGERPELYVNRLVYASVLEWAYRSGYRMVDFAGMNPEVAAAVLEKRQLPDHLRSAQDVFHLRCGAEPRLLPPARLRLTSPALRWWSTLGGRFSVLERLAVTKL